MRWLNNVGRRNRSRKNVKLENFITEMQRLTLVHERDAQGESYYRISAGPSQDEKNGQKGKGGGSKEEKTGNGKKDASREKGTRVERQGSKESKAASSRADTPSAQDKPETREGAGRPEEAGDDKSSS